MDAKLKIALVVPIAVVMVLGLKAIFPEPHKSPVDDAFFWSNKTHNVARYNVLAIGDSRMYRGFAAGEMEESLDDLSVMNLGYPSNGYSDQYYEFVESRLHDGDEPRVIIMGITPYSLTGDAQANESYNQYLQEKWNDKLKNTYVKKHLRYFNPYVVHEIEDYYNGVEDETWFREKYTEGGWIATDVKPFDSTSAEGSYLGIFDGNRVEDTVTTKLMHKVKEWTDQGISVIGFRPPTTYRMVAIEDSLSGANYNTIIAQFEAQGGIWLEFNNSDFSSYDGSHLTPESGIELANRVAVEVKKILAN